LDEERLSCRIRPYRVKIKKKGLKRVKGKKNNVLKNN